MLARLVLDDRSTHLCCGEVVSQTGADKRSGADSDIDVKVVEIDAVESLIKGSDCADFVN
jgi:hypothetical protein